MDESKPTELGKRIGARGSEKRAEWLSRWGHLYEEFQNTPTVVTAVDLLSLTNPPLVIVKELREFIINPPKKSRGRPRKPQRFYDQVAFMFEAIKLENLEALAKEKAEGKNDIRKKTALDIDNEIVAEFFSDKNEEDGDVDAETVRKWRNKAKVARNFWLAF